MIDYKRELDFTLAAKHVAAFEAKKAIAKLDELTKKAKALNVLAGAPYDFKSLNDREADLRFQMDSYINEHWTNGNEYNWKFGRAIVKFEEALKLAPVTDEDVLTYAGVLVDLLEYSETIEEPISPLRFRLRVFYADDYKALIEDLAEEAGLTRKAA